MAEQHLGNGTVISFVSTSGATVALGGVLSVEGPDSEREDVNVTVLASTSPWDTFKLGSGDPGTVTLQIAYDNQEDSQIRINAMLNTMNSTAVTFTITYNSSLTPDTFTALVKGRGRTIERNGMIQGPVTLKLSGDPGFASST